MAETFTAAVDLHGLLPPNHPLRRGVTLVAPDRETAAGLREVAGVRVRVLVQPTLPASFGHLPAHQCPACRHTHPVELPCFKALRVIQTLRAGGPAQTRPLDDGDPSSSVEWEAYWSMVGAWRAAMEYGRAARKLEAGGERAVSAVGAILGGTK